MNIFLRILIGLAVAALGTFLVVKTQLMLDTFGYVDWAEQKLSGGTRLFYKLLGILICFIGFMVATNLWDAFLQSTLGSVFPAGRPPAAVTTDNTYAP